MKLSSYDGGYFDDVHGVYYRPRPLPEIENQEIPMSYLIYNKLEGREVTISRPKSRIHNLACDLAVDGVIMDYDPDHMEGHITRPLLVEFKDGRRSWWQVWELSFTNPPGTGDTLAGIIFDLSKTHLNAINFLGKLPVYLGITLSSSELETVLHAAMAQLSQPEANTDYNLTKEAAELIVLNLHSILETYRKD